MRILVCIAAAAARRVDGLSNRKGEADIRVINSLLLSVRSAVGISANLMTRFFNILLDFDWYAAWIIRIYKKNSIV